ncbi:MAG: hypothetical protein IIW22_02035 [Erysipelotrichaceae bacterium]|nr:hypothetical protein [Erysipelotrichaceae bacterium]
MRFVKYTLLCMGIFLSLSAAEILLLNPVADFFGSSYLSHLIFYLVLLLILDPVITRILSEKIRKHFNPEEGEQV